jgi:hypothetical protein
MWKWQKILRLMAAVSLNAWPYATLHQVRAGAGLSGSPEQFRPVFFRISSLTSNKTKLKKKKFFEIYVKDAAAMAAIQMSICGAVILIRPWYVNKVGVDAKIYV